MRLATVLVVALVVVQAAGAAPSFLGYTGLLNVPTADTLDRNEFNLAYLNLDLGDIDENRYCANVGLMDGLEVGVLRSKVEKAEGETMLNAKYRIIAEDAKRAGLAVGALDPTNEIRSTMYVVASKVLFGRARIFDGEITSVSAHVGLGAGMLEGPFVGLSGALGERLLLIAEYDSDDVNLGGRLNIGYGFRAHAAWFNDLNDIGLGISYNKMF